MKTWEVYKLLLENPKAKFKRIEDGYIYHIDNENKLVCEQKDDWDCERIDEEWELIKEPVTWQEAIQAWLNGKNILVEVNGSKYFQPQRNPLGLFIGCQTGFFTDMFTKGEWYVED